MLRNAAELGHRAGRRRRRRPALLDPRARERPAARARRVPAGRARRAAELREPHRVARYLEELAGTYHRFYDACRVLPRATSRPTPTDRAPGCWLFEATRIVLANGLGLLGVSRPGADVSAAATRGRCALHGTGRAADGPAWLGAPPDDLNALDAARLAAHGARGRRRAARSAASPSPSWPPSTAPRLYVLDEADFRARAPRASRPPSPARDVLLRGQGVPVHGGRPQGRRGGPQPRRLHRRRAGRRAAPPGFPAERIALHGNNKSVAELQPRRRRRRRPDRRRLLRRDRPAEPRSRRGRRRRASGCWSGSRSASRRTPTSSSPPPTRTRSSASRWPAARRPRPCAACSRADGARARRPALPHRLADLRHLRLRGRRAPRARPARPVRDEHGVELPELDLGGGFGIAYTSPRTTRSTPARPRRAAAQRSSSASARGRPGGAAAVRRAGPGDRRSGTVHALRGRHGQGRR